LRISVKVLPGAGSNKINGYKNGELVVKINAQPEKGKANKELIKYLSGLCGIPKGVMEIVSGSLSRHKILEFPDEYRKNIKKLSAIV